MVSIIKSHDVLSSSILPNEVMSVICDYADMCSSIVKNCNNSIEVYDFKTLKRMLKIKTRTEYIKKISVSPCGTFVSGSCEDNYIGIWNIKTGELIQVLLYEEGTYGPDHTFTPKNELLITNANIIYYYKYSLETNEWYEYYVYEIPNLTGKISYITHNLSNDMLALGTNQGDVFIFDTKMKTIVHTFNLISSNDRRIDINSIYFNKNYILVSSWNEKYFIINIDINKIILLEKPNFGYERIILIIDNIMLTPCLTKVIGNHQYNKLTFIWDIKTGKIIKQLDIKLSSHFNFTPGGTKLISCDNDIFNKINVIDWKFYLE